MRSRLVFSVLLGVLLIWPLDGGSQEPAATVSVAIDSPNDGLATSDVSVQVKGKASVARAASLSLVIITVNGVAQKANLKGDGNFEASVNLSRGLNIIAAIAVNSSNEIASDRVMVTSVPEILFFDDFTGKARPEWRFKTVGASGRWGESGGWYTVLNVPDWHPMQTFVGEPWWTNYMIDLDVSFDNSNEGRHVVAIFARVQDEHNMFGFFLQPSGKSGFKIQQRGEGWGDFLASADTPRFNNAHVRVIVKDHTYTAVLLFPNGQQITVSYEDKRRTFAQGYTGLQAAVKYYYYVYFDNFQVKSLDVSAAPISFQPPSSGQPATTWEPRVTALESKVTNLETTVGTLSGRVDLLEKQPPSSGISVEFSRRVEKLESLVGDADVKGLSSEVRTVKATVASLSSEHTHFKQELEELKRVPVSAEVQDRLGQIQQSLEALNRKAEENNSKLEAAKSLAQLGLLVGAAGAALALLVASGVLR